MNLKKETSHVVIEFVGPYPPGQKKDVDLVPASWLKFVKGKWTCKYPPQKNYSKRTNWTKKSRLPNADWLAWTVKIIKEAKNYDEGVRRLERSYVTSNVESTSAADDSNHETNNNDQQRPKVLNLNQKNLELKRTVPIEETNTEHEVGASGANNTNLPVRESSTDTVDSSEVDENEQTLIHYVQSPQSTKGALKSYALKRSANIRRSDTLSDEQKSSPSPRKRRNRKPLKGNADTSSDEQGSSYAPRERRSSEPLVVLTDTSSDERRQSPPKKKRKKSQLPVVITPQANNVLQQQPHIQSVTQEGLERGLNRMEERIIKKIESAKRSVLYDVNIKVEQLKHTMVFNSERSGMNIVENRKCLNIKLPVQDPVAFETFDEALRTAPDKAKALKCIMTAAINGIDSGNKAVTNILKSVLGKPVQEVYSACGRVTKGNAKKNFSKTKTYSCMQDVVCDNHNITRDNILSVTSRWLSGCVDRDGGRVRPAAQVVPAMPIVPAAQAAPIVPIVPLVPPLPAAPVVPIASAVVMDHQAQPAVPAPVQQQEPQ